MSYIRIISGLALVFACLLAGAGAYEDMLEAVKKDNVPAVNLLLKRGVDVNTTDQEGNSLLILAVKEGSLQAVKALLAARARVDAHNALGETALMLAALQGQLEVVRSLLVQGALVNQPGWTPLIYSAVNNRVDIARLLIGRGAKIDAAADIKLRVDRLLALRTTENPTLRQRIIDSDTKLEQNKGCDCRKRIRNQSAYLWFVWTCR